MGNEKQGKAVSSLIAMGGPAYSQAGCSLGCLLKLGGSIIEAVLPWVGMEWGGCSAQGEGHSWSSGQAEKLVSWLSGCSRDEVGCLGQGQSWGWAAVQHWWEGTSIRQAPVAIMVGGLGCRRHKRGEALDTRGRSGACIPKPGITQPPMETCHSACVSRGVHH